MGEKCFVNSMTPYQPHGTHLHSSWTALSSSREISSISVKPKSRTGPGGMLARLWAIRASLATLSTSCAHSALKLPIETRSPTPENRIAWYLMSHVQRPSFRTLSNWSSPLSLSSPSSASAGGSMVVNGFVQPSYLDLWPWVVTFQVSLRSATTAISLLRVTVYSFIMADDWGKFPSLNRRGYSHICHFLLLLLPSLSLSLSLSLSFSSPDRCWWFWSWCWFPEGRWMGGRRWRTRYWGESSVTPYQWLDVRKALWISLIIMCHLYHLVHIVLYGISCSLCIVHECSLFSWKCT